MIEDLFFHSNNNQNSIDIFYIIFEINHQSIKAQAKMTWQSIITYVNFRSIICEPNGE